MLKHIDNIKWVGALSLEDADVLAQKSKAALNILEFGPGGSTMIFLQSMNIDGSVTCVETENVWITELNARLDLIEKKADYDFISYDAFLSLRMPEESFDLIFVDGHKSLREDFARRSWHLLKNGGEMAFHDTKREEYVRNILPLIRERFLEINNIQFNVIASNGQNSNITSIRKISKIKPANNFQSVEQERETWTFGGIEQHNYTIDKGLFVYKNTGG